MINLLKKLPWWTWITIAVAIFIIWQSLSGWAQSRKLYNMALDQLREDQTNIIEIKEAYIKDCESEISRLAEEKEVLRRQKEAIQKQANESAMEIARLEGNIRALEIKLRNITISTDIDAIIDDLRKRGLSTIRRHR